MIGWVVAALLLGGVVGYRAGVFYQVYYKFGDKKPKVPPYDKLVNLDMYKKYRIK